MSRPVLINNILIPHIGRATQLALTAPAHGAQPPPIGFFTGRVAHVVRVAFFHVEIDLLNDEFALLVFLTGFVGPGVGPSHHALAAFAKDITDTVKTRDEQAVFGRAAGDVDALIKEIGAAMASMEALGDDIIVTGEMCSTMRTRIDLWTIQIDHGIIYSLCVSGSHLVDGDSRIAHGGTILGDCRGGFSLLIKGASARKGTARERGRTR